MLRRAFVLLLAVAALTACTTPYKTPTYAARPGESTDFDGIAQTVANAPGRTLDILFVHGMCTHDATWAQGAVQNVYRALGGDAATVALDEVPVAGTGIMLYQQTLSAMGGALRVNAIVWSPLTTPLKAQLCYDQTDKSATCPAAEAAKRYPYKRATLNRILKDTILDDCLADAMIYQGRSRDEMNAQMRQAILQAAATSGGKARPANLTAAAAAETAPLVVVTESLGSKIAFDAIYKLSTDTDANTAAAGNALFDRTTQIFMGANQLPILALADRQLDGSVARARPQGATNAPAPYPEDPIAALASRRAGAFSAARAATPLRVVAFTDPNDMLSYVLVPSVHAQMGYSVVDVVVSNANTYLGLAELPTTAHLGYRHNEDVRRLIACGHPRSALCKP